MWISLTQINDNVLFNNQREKINNVRHIMQTFTICVSVHIANSNVHILLTLTGSDGLDVRCT